MDKSAVITLLFMRIEQFKKDVTEFVDSIFIDVDNPESRASFLCNFISHVVDNLEEVFDED